jgi:hypothetical protein
LNWRALQRLWAALREGLCVYPQADIVATQLLDACKLLPNPTHNPHNVVFMPISELSISREGLNSTTTRRPFALPSPQDGRPGQKVNWVRRTATLSGIPPIIGIVGKIKGGGGKSLAGQLVETSRVDEKGRGIIPKRLREKAKVREGGCARIEAE